MITSAYESHDDNDNTDKYEHDKEYSINCYGNHMPDIKPACIVFITVCAGKSG